MEPTPPKLDLAALFTEHQHGLSGAIRGVLGSSADVPEVLQAAFLKAFEATESGTVPREPVGWIFVLTIHLARSMRRTRVRRGIARDIDEVDEMKLKAEAPGPPEVAASREAMRAAQGAIAELPDAQKEVFLLRVSGGLSFVQVAAALGVPEGTAKTRMRSALAQLRRSLDSIAPNYRPVTDEGGAR